MQLFYSEKSANRLIAQASEKLATREYDDVLTDAITHIGKIARVLVQKRIDGVVGGEAEPKIRSHVLSLSYMTLCLLLNIAEFEEIVIDKEAFTELDGVCGLVDATNMSNELIKKISIEFPHQYHTLDLSRLAELLQTIPIDILEIRTCLPESIIDSLDAFDTILFSVNDWHELDPILFLLSEKIWYDCPPLLEFNCETLKGTLSKLSLSNLKCFLKVYDVSVSIISFNTL